ncbi:hypothetical protein MKZ38_007457 [Zalerion maritima]|uniref:DUF8035 domain-containing protein n=1 Tax=Zalerion maritima TaxID=339359 RepID=A0AAD5RI16_9PEZI|nr:hypothetical protein MKZ38_007457 [Zalerion maritima]
MTDSRYVPAYPAPGRRSPTYNTARLSMPTVPSGGAPGPTQYSLYSGPIPLMPPSTHQHPAPPPPQHHHHHQQHYDAPARRQTNPTQPSTTTYQVAQDPVTRSSSLRQMANGPSSSATNRSGRSSTLDANANRPIVITSGGANRPHASSSHSSGRPGDRSPSRDAYRTGDDQYYSQPASSMRTRSSHRPAYSATLDNDELARLRDRGDPRLLEPYRPIGSGGPVYHSSKHPRSSSAAGSAAGGGVTSSSKDHKQQAYVPEEGYEYYRPADLARFDLENPNAAGGSSRRRRESVDRGSYHRPSVVVNSPYDRSRPPPTTRGLEKINRTSAAYDGPIRMPVPAVAQSPLGSSDTSSRRSASDSKPLSPPTRRERPTSMYHDERAYHHQDTPYYPFPEEERHHHERRDVDREYDRRYDAGDGFHDDSVPARGFGVRTEDQYEPATSYRRPTSEYLDMPVEPRRRSDESLDPYDERDSEDRYRRDRHRARQADEVPRPSTGKEEDKSGFKKKMAAGIGAAASTIGLRKGEKEGKDDDSRRGRSLEDEVRRDRRYDSPSRERSRSRSRSRTRAPDRSIEPGRETSRDRDIRVDRRDRNVTEDEEYKERNRRAAEDKLNGASPSSSGQLTPTSDDEHKASEVSKRKNRRSFKPNDPTDLMDIKAQLDELDQKAASRDVDSRNTSGSPVKQITDGRPPVEEENRGRELVVTPPEGAKQVRVVSPPRDKSEARPKLKGILKPPSQKFPEEPNPIREGVAPHKDDKTKKDAPPGARWTKIRRDIVNPEALTAGKERFEVRDNFVIVLRVLNKDEIEQYAYATQLIREKRHEEKLRKEKAERERNYDRGYSKDRDHERDRTRERDDDDRDRRHHKPHRRDDEDDRKHRESKDRDYERDREKERRRHRYDSDAAPFDDEQRTADYHGHGSNYHRSHKDQDE